MASESQDSVQVSDSDDDLHREEEKQYLALPKKRAITLSGQWPETGYSPKWGGPSMCVYCLEFFDLPDQMAQFKTHLLDQHRIVINKLEEIVDPKRYVEYWRIRFSKTSIDRIFPLVQVKKGDNLYGKVDSYYHIAPTVKEDGNLRRNLALRRLEEALACQQRERDDNDSYLKCLFCPYTSRKSRTNLIMHLFNAHHLNLGKADNLVFLREYLDVLRTKIEKNQCIYCETNFPDKTVLMEHMKRKNHREVNPKDHYYDKFYIINYLEVGKRWLDVLRDFETPTKKAMKNHFGEVEECNWNEWEKDNILDDTRAVCVMCDFAEDTLEGLLSHMAASHGLNLPKEISKMRCDTYMRMKLINYIRKQIYNGHCWICSKKIGNPNQLMKHFAEEETPFTKLPSKDLWDNEENLIPMFCNDNLLWLLESYFAENDNSNIGPCGDFKKLTELIEESKSGYIDGVIAEDLPDLKNLDVSDFDLLK